MRPVQAMLLARVTNRGFVSVRDEPRRDRTLRRMAAEGTLRPVLKGVYARPDEHRIQVLTRAVVRCYPDAVITGRAAAVLTFWPELECAKIVVARRHRTLDRPPFTFHQRVIPDELVARRGPVAVTAPALTAVDLCCELGGDAIDRVLRLRVASLDRLWNAYRLTAGRVGNARRLRLLIESRTEPWSTAERRLHTVLRESGIRGWRANTMLELPEGFWYAPDVRFDRLRLILEVEGNAFHSDRDQLHRDRSRQNALTLAGWRILRLDWDMLTTHPEEVVAMVRRALRDAG